eukprot:scaffold24180_cov157-Isochrysis_galbana.AAC.3
MGGNCNRLDPHAGTPFKSYTPTHSYLSPPLSHPACTRRHGNTPCAHVASAQGKGRERLASAGCRGSFRPETVGPHICHALVELEQVLVAVDLSLVQQARGVQALPPLASARDLEAAALASLHARIDRALSSRDARTASGTGTGQGLRVVWRCGDRAYPEGVARAPVAMLGHAVAMCVHQRPAFERESQQLLQLRQLRGSPLLPLQREVVHRRTCSQKR